MGFVDICLGPGGELYACDDNPSQVTRWVLGAAAGEVVAGGNGRGSELNQLSEPQGICMSPSGELYVSDFDTTGSLGGCLGRQQAKWWRGVMVTVVG